MFDQVTMECVQSRHKNLRTFHLLKHQLAYPCTEIICTSENRVNRQPVCKYKCRMQWIFAPTEIN